MQSATKDILIKKYVLEVVKDYTYGAMGEMEYVSFIIPKGTLLNIELRGCKLIQEGLYSRFIYNNHVCVFHGDLSETLKDKNAWLSESRIK